MTGNPRLTAGFGWEQHCCLPLEAGCDIAPLDRYRQVGVGYVSVNVGYAPHDIDATMRVLSSWRRQLARAGGSFQLVGTAGEIAAAQQAGRLVVGFDLEDTNPLGGEVAMIAVDPEHQRRGLATALTETATVWLRDQGPGPQWSTPVAIPRPSSCHTRSSVARLPVALPA